MEPKLMAAHGPALAALRRLPERQREALVLRYHLDLSGPRDRSLDGHRPGHCEVHHIPGPGRARPPAGGAPGSYPQGTDVLWTNASGSTLIVSNAGTVGVLAGGQFTPLPGASNVGIMSAW
jgi:hypothetical protein